MSHLMWIGTDTVRRYMDPEERLWFLEEAVAAYLAEPEPAGDLVFADLNDGHQWVWLVREGATVRVEVGARELFVNRPLSLEAVGRLAEIGYKSAANSVGFGRREVLAAATRSS